DAATGKPLTPPLAHEHMVVHAIFSPDGTRVATASLDRTARVWDAESGKPVGTALVQDGWVMQTAFNPEGQFLVTAGRDGMARVWDLLASPTSRRSAERFFFYGLTTFSPDGRLRLQCQEPISRPRAYWADAATGEHLPPNPEHYFMKHYRPAFSADSRR